LDYAKALELYEKAATQSFNCSVQSWSILSDKIRVNLNYRKVMKRYGKAVSQGDSNAKFNIGIFYENGLGVEVNYGIAIKWCLKAHSGNNDALE